MPGRTSIALVVGLSLALGLTSCGPGKAPPPPVIQDFENIAARIFAGARDNAGALKILGNTKKASEIKDFLSATKAAERRGLSIFAPIGVRSAAAAFEDSLRKYTSGVVVIEGHNEGGFLKFYDGTSFDLSRLAATNTSVTFAVVSCESAAFLKGGGIGLLTEVASNVAALTETKFVARVKQSILPTREQLQSMMDLSATEAKAETAHAENVIFFRLGGAGVAGIVTIGFLEQFDP